MRLTSITSRDSSGRECKIGQWDISSWMRIQFGLRFIQILKVQGNLAIIGADAAMEYPKSFTSVNNPD